MLWNILVKEVIKYALRDDEGCIIFALQDSRPCSHAGPHTIFLALVQINFLLLILLFRPYEKNG